MVGSSSISAEPLAFIVTLDGGGPSIRLPIIGSSFTVGRDSSNNLCISDDEAISRQHSRIHVMGASLILEDLSRNGTFLDDERVLGVVPLPIPSMVLVGRTRLAIVPNTPDEGRATSVMPSYSAVTSEDIAAAAATAARLSLRTDALLVVDLVDSTRLVREDASQFARLVLAMGRALEQSLRNEPAPFMKCTGDGFFACFSSPRAALEAGRALAPALAPQVSIKFQLSVALHWGPCHLTEQGDRIGNNAHAVFALEGVRHNIPGLVEELQAKGTGELLLMTEAFWSELSEKDRALAHPIGSYSLKGMNEPTKVLRLLESTPT